MKKFTLTTLALSITAAVIGGSVSFSADKKAEPKATELKTLSKEQRQEMAEVHQKMADCLKSDKPMSECKSEMMKSCHDAMGKGGCPMMSEMGGMMDHGAMHNGNSK